VGGASAQPGVGAGSASEGAAAVGVGAVGAAALGAGVNIDVVEAHRDVGHDAKLGSRAEKFIINLFGQQADQAFSVFYATQNLVARWSFGLRPKLDIAVGV